MSGNRDKALVESELARRMGADEAWCGLIDGLALLFSGEADDAIHALLQAKQADPESIAIRCALAIGYSMTGEGDKWVAECEEMKSMELPPDDPEAHLLMAYNREGRGTPDELQSLLDRYFQLRGDSVVGRIVRAIVLSAIAARTRDPEYIRQAERAVLVAVELAPTNDVVLTAMMRVHRAGISVLFASGTWRIRQSIIGNWRKKPSPRSAIVPVSRRHTKRRQNFCSKSLVMPIAHASTGTWCASSDL